MSEGTWYNLEEEMEFVDPLVASLLGGKLECMSEVSHDGDSVERKLKECELLGSIYVAPDGTLVLKSVSYGQTPGDGMDVLIRKRA